MAATKIKDIEITDVRYDDGSQGARSVLLVVAKYTATPFDSSAVGNIVGTIAALATQEGNFKPGLVGLNIQMLDANLTLKQIVVVKWQDIVDFVTGRITGEQLIERLMIVSP